MSNELAFVIYDKYAVSEGHVLVVSRRHVADYFDLSEEEKDTVWAFVMLRGVF